MGKKWVDALILAGITVVGLAGTLLLKQSSAFHALDLKLSDINFFLREPHEPDTTVLIAADQKSLDTFPELLVFWHPYYAKAIRAAAQGGAKVIGLDVAFGVPVNKWEPNHDSLLAEAVLEVSPKTPVICGYVPSLLEKQRNWPVPINMIASSLGFAAFSNLTVDSDDFVRRQELFEAPAPGHGAESNIARSFALRLAEKYLGVDARLEAGGLSLGGREVPVEDRTIRINFAGPPGTFPRHSLVDVVAAYDAGKRDELESWFRGKAVLIGPDQIDDRHATPYYGVQESGRWNTAGVEIHANTLETVLKGQYLSHAPERVDFLLLVLVGAVPSYGAFSLHASVVAAGLLGVWVFAVGLTEVFFRAGWILSSAGLVVVSLLCCLGSLLYRFATAESRGDLFRKAVSLFVGRDVAHSLDSSAQLGLTGVRKEVTILFTDLRGFTTFCDSQQPARVVELLNEYFSIIVRMVVAHGGQVNKFLGDGMLAVFTPDDQPASAGQGNHATRAVRCARSIVMFEHPVFQTGAGLHSGPVVIGNIGSAEKLEYTVMGDTVNLASRLESLNKEKKTRLLISEETRLLLESGPELEVVRLGEVAVRGKADPVGIYTLADLTPTVGEHPPEIGGEAAETESVK